MSEVLIVHPKKKVDRPSQAGNSDRRKLLVGSLVAILTPVVLATHAWAQGCSCG
jgi:hypothetical protein